MLVRDAEAAAARERLLSEAGMGRHRIQVLGVYGSCM